MKLSEAVSRLKFTISKGNKPAQADIEAFNKIAEYLQEVQQETIQHNVPFAKLYAYVLGKFTPHYNNVDQANKHLNRILTEPLPNLVETLRTELQAMEVRQIMPDPILDNKNPESTKQVMERYPKFQEEFLTAWDYWDTRNVTAHLELNINLSLQKFKNDI